MSDMDDIRQDAYYERIREKNERDWCVRLSILIDVRVKASKNADEEELTELALDNMDINDLVDCEFVEAVIE